MKVYYLRKRGVMQLYAHRIITQFENCIFSECIIIIILPELIAILS